MESVLFSLFSSSSKYSVQARTPYCVEKVDGQIVQLLTSPLGHPAKNGDERDLKGSSILHFSFFWSYPYMRMTDTIASLGFHSASPW